jgi:fumarate reductase iron-sulfur subunit
LCPTKHRRLKSFGSPSPLIRIIIIISKSSYRKESEVRFVSNKTLKVKVFRFDRSVDKDSYYDTYEVPVQKGMSAMNALDYIYQNLDSTLAYYEHAGCDLGICGRCTGKINGKVGLFCQTLINADVTLEPLSEANVLKDLVMKRKEESK